MDRREFLKKAGLGSIAVASLSALGQALAAPAWADDEDDDNEEEGRKTNFFFVVVSKLVGGADLVILNGTGWFGRSKVKGRGSFTHFTPAASPPFPIVASGAWRARQLLNFFPTSPPTYGAHAAGRLEMLVRLSPTGAERINAVMEVVCNIPPGGLLTGEHEGVTLILNPPAGPVFAPLEPAVGVNPGLTTFTRRARRED